MFRHRFLRTLTAWLAALAVLCAGLLPLVSHAVVPHLQAQAGMVEVCTVTGMAWVNVGAGVGVDGQAGAQAPAASLAAKPGGSPTAPLSPDMAMGHCDWCATHAPALGMPPPVATAQLPPAVLAAQPPAFWQAPRLLFAWAAAQPRAPPTTA